MMLQLVRFELWLWMLEYAFLCIVLVDHRVHSLEFCWKNVRRCWWVLLAWLMSDKYLSVVILMMAIWVWWFEWWQFEVDYFHRSLHIVGEYIECECMIESVCGGGFWWVNCYWWCVWREECAIYSDWWIVFVIVVIDIIDVVFCCLVFGIVELYE